MCARDGAVCRTAGGNAAQAQTALLDPGADDYTWDREKKIRDGLLTFAIAHGKEGRRRRAKVVEEGSGRNRRDKLSSRQGLVSRGRGNSGVRSSSGGGSSSDGSRTSSGSGSGVSGGNGGGPS